MIRYGPGGREAPVIVLTDRGAGRTACNEAGRGGDPITWVRGSPQILPTQGGDIAKRTRLAAAGAAAGGHDRVLRDGRRRQASTPSPVVGYTYIDGNTAAANTIDGFARHTDGSLTPLPGAPFPAGARAGPGLASQGAIQATHDGRYLLAVDAGSNQISVLRITAGGVPVRVGDPGPRAGQPVSIAVSPSGLVYVANSGTGPATTPVPASPGGALSPVPGSTYTVPVARAWATCSSTPSAITSSAPAPAPR